MYTVEFDGKQYQVSADSYMNAAREALQTAGLVVLDTMWLDNSWMGHLYVAQCATDSDDVKKLVLVWHRWLTETKGI